MMPPPEEYGWLGARGQESGSGSNAGSREGLKPGSSVEDIVPGAESVPGTLIAEQAAGEEGDIQKSFFDYPGPLYRISISPASSTMESDRRGRKRGTYGCGIRRIPCTC